MQITILQRMDARAPTANYSRSSDKLTLSEIGGAEGTCCVYVVGLGRIMVFAAWEPQNAALLHLLGGALDLANNSARVLSDPLCGPIMGCVAFGVCVRVD